MKHLAEKYKRHLTHRQFIISAATAVLLLLISFVVNFYAGEYATEKASTAVTDIVLNNIRVFDVGAIFVYGPVVLWAFVSALCFLEPKRIPFVLKSIAVFVLIRSLFVTLTHLGAFPDQLAIDYTSDVIKKITFGGDLFFSGHTGAPFLMALVFWDHRYLRAIFVITAVFFGAIVLMAHLHYSIDVLAAFFITYTIFHIAKTIFKKDWAMFNEGIPTS